MYLVLYCKFDIINIFIELKKIFLIYFYKTTEISFNYNKSLASILGLKIYQHVVLLLKYFLQIFEHFSPNRLFIRLKLVKGSLEINL